jgi:putative flavoprotein involved in K+ transport
VSEAWLEFETEVGRGSGHLRLIDGQAWTLLTALDELKGHEESLGPRRPKGVEHGASPSAAPGSRIAGTRPRSWGARPSHTW